MKTQKAFKTTGIVIVLIGIIHLCATPLILKGFRVLNQGNFFTFIYMFLFTGVSVVFIGWLQYFIVNKLVNNVIAVRMLKVSTFVILATGLGAVAAMPDNPFAWLILVVAIVEVILISNKKAWTLNTLNKQ